MKRQKIRILAAMAFLPLLPVHAQRFTHSFRDASMSEALALLAKSTKNYHVNFVYNELEDFMVTTNIVRRNTLDAIQQIIGFYPVKITIDGDNIFVECTQKASSKMMGRVMDTRRRPVDFANVALLSPVDSTFITGGVTNENGQFVIPCEARRTIVRVSCVGYQTAYGTYDTGKLGNITLKEATMNLQKVLVKGHRQPFRMTSEGLVAQVEGTSLAKMGSAQEVLTHLPRVVRKNGELEVLGKGAPLIYIDNKKVTGAVELDRLSASNIRHVEIITEPGAEYDATCGAVIRIKTAKKQGDGFGLGYRQTYQRNHQDSHSEVLDINYRYHGLDVFSTLYYSLSQGYQEQKNDNLLYGKTLMHIKEDLTIHDKSAYLSGSLGFNYVFNDSHSLGATYEGSVNPYGRGGWNSHFDVWKNGALAEGYDNEYKAGFKPRPTHDITAYYAGLIGKVHIDWNGEIYLRKSGQTQYSQEQNTMQGGSRIVESDYMADSWMHATKLVLSVPIWKGTVKLGSEYTESCRANLYTIDNQGDDLPGKTDDQVKESNLAVFASYGVNLKRLQLNAGMRYEHVSSNYLNKGKDVWDENHQEYQPDMNRKYDNFFPQLTLLLPIKQVKLSASYRVTVSRPSYRQLSSNVQYNSRYYFQGGNPLLQPTYDHAFGLNVGYRWLQLFANWHEVDDRSYQCIEPYKESSNELISMYTFRNLKHSQSCNLGLTASPKIGWWRPTLNASVRKQWMRIGETRYDHSLFVGSLNNEITFPHDWIFRLDMDYNSNGHSGTIEWRQQGGVDVSLNKGFLHDRLNVTVAGHDLLASRRTTSRLVYGTSDIYNWKYTDTRKLLLTLNYKFNVTRSKYKGTGAGEAEKNRL